MTIQFCGAEFPLGGSGPNDPLDVYVKVDGRYYTVQWISINGAAVYNINPDSSVTNRLLEP